MDIIKWIQDWYKNNCNGYWENMYGIEISNIDNPGWRVKIDLSETSLEKKEFIEVKEDLGDDDWFVCGVNGNVFDACGDSGKLEKILYIFKEWTEINYD